MIKLHVQCITISVIVTLATTYTCRRPDLHAKYANSILEPKQIQ
jgi:hypothetical protein